MAIADGSRRSEILPHVVQLRRWFHQHPELSYQEKDTAQHIMQELDRLQIPYRYGGVGRGVIARLTVDNAAPTIALRADMDALPGNETTGVDYASVNEGAMHACGHGAHMAMLLEAARLLVETPPANNVVFIFQPGEEKGGGSRTIIEDGALQGVDAIFAGHVSHEYETGSVMVTAGTVTAQSDGFVLQIRGKGGHGARPHETTDAVVIAGFMIVALQTLISRESNPLHPSVVTIGAVHAGTAGNVIAEEATLRGSIRTTRDESRNHIHAGIRRMADAAALLHNARISVQISEGYPPVVNTRREATIAWQAAEKVYGVDHVFGMEFPSMGSEDFSYYLQHVPGCFVRFGARRRDWEPVPLHSPAFNIDEDMLPQGAEFLAELARGYTRLGSN
ncbi:MAG TPA: M20 family metallopeptidase [Woeseiaceae bacterium]